MNQKYVSLQIRDGDVNVRAAVVPDAVLLAALVATDDPVRVSTELEIG